MGAMTLSAHPKGPSSCIMLSDGVQDRWGGIWVLVDRQAAPCMGLCMVSVHGWCMGGVWGLHKCKVSDMNTLVDSV